MSLENGPPTRAIDSPRRRRALLRGVLTVLVGGLVIVAPRVASAFWVVNFGPAEPLPPHKIGFAAGIGGQAVLTGTPTRVNAFFLIPHAGLRLGLLERMDLGLRLAPIPLPFSTVGPSFGVNLDAKVRLTDPGSNVAFALVAGAGAGHVLVLDDNRVAVSPNGAALLTFHTSESTRLTFMGRYVYLGIPTAKGGARENFVHIVGASAGLKLDIAPKIALLPEVGAYWYEGRLGDVRTSGPGFQYGLMLGTAF